MKKESAVVALQLPRIYLYRFSNQQIDGKQDCLGQQLTAGHSGEEQICCDHTDFLGGDVDGGQRRCGVLYCI